MSPDDAPDSAAADEERRRVRELRTSVDLTCAVLRQGRLSREEADELVAAMRGRAIELFPEKEDVFDLVLAPRFQRIIDEVLDRVQMTRCQCPTHAKSRITPSSS